MDKPGEFGHSMPLMIDVLETPEIRQRVSRITIGQYHRMISNGDFDGRPVELLHGLLIDKMSKSELHIYLVRFFFRALSHFCDKDAYQIFKEDPITIGDSEPEPDLAVVAGPFEAFVNSKPSTALLVIEVAVTSLAIDRAKASAYAEAGIGEYWIVQPDSKVTECYRRPKDGAYQEVTQVSANTTLESVALPGFTFDLQEALELPDPPLT